MLDAREENHDGMLASVVMKYMLVKSERKLGINIVRLLLTNGGIYIKTE